MSGARASRGVLAGGLAVLAGVLVGLLVVLLVGGADLWPFGGGTASTSSTSSSGSAPAGPLDPSPVPAPSVLPSSTSPAPLTPTTAGLAAALAGPLRAPVLGPRVGVAVVDPATGVTLFEQRSALPQKPASTLKTVTAVSALHFIGPDATLRTRTVAGASPGEVVLVGGGDPTITLKGSRSYPRLASLDALAVQTAAKVRAGGRTSVRLVLDDTFFTGPRTGPGWLPADLRAGLVSRVSALTVDEARVSPARDARYADPTGAAGRDFARALRLHGVKVTATSRGTAPAAAAALGSVSSPPVSALVERMLLTSDNDLGEALAHVAGAAAGTGASFAGGAEASRRSLVWLGIDPATAVVVDGSGISVRNRLDASLLAATVSASTRADHPELASLLSGLPVAGVSGTLADRFATARTAAARGQVRAKTGTLTGVHSFVGTVLDRDGRTLVFTVLADRTSVDTLAARAALDRVAAALQRCGCRS